MKRIIERIKSRFSHMSGTIPKNTVHCSDISICDCLVGIVKNQNQLKANLEHSFYHVPAKFIYELDLPLSYIALYTSARTFGDEAAGISYYGRIVTHEVIPRRNITYIPRDSTELYFVFTVEKWERLDRPIRPLETANIVTMTCLELLKQSEFMPELYMRSWEEFRLFQFLKAVCMDGETGIRYNFNGTRIFAARNNIEVIFPSGERHKFDRYIYRGKPFSLYRRLMVKIK